MTFARRDLLLGAAGSLIAAAQGQALAQGQEAQGQPAQGQPTQAQPTQGQPIQDSRPAYDMLDKPAPAFRLPRRGGGNTTLADYQGRVLILSFGGLWCPPCIGDGANTNQLAASAAEADIDFLYMQCGPEFGLWSSQNARRRPRVSDAERAWTLYFNEHHYDYPVAFDMSQGREISHLFAIRWFPSNLIIDRHGVIRAWRAILGRRGGERFFARAREVAEEAA